LRIIEEDFSLMKSSSMASNPIIVANMQNFTQSAKNFGIDISEIIERFFGQKYYKNEPMTWYYFVQKKLQFIGTDLVDVVRHFNLTFDDIRVRKENGDVKFFQNSAEITHFFHAAQPSDDHLVDMRKFLRSG